MNSCPAGVSVSHSKIKHAGLGAWADVVIEPGTTFGPYTGDIVNSKKAADRSGYSWEIIHKGKRYFVDGVDESKGNWMRFVNHASARRLGYIWNSICDVCGLGAQLRRFEGKYRRSTPLQKAQLIYFKKKIRRKSGASITKVVIVATGSKSTKDKNMEAIQLKGQIYYVVTRQIRIGEELFVDYGQDYGKTLSETAASSTTRKLAPREENSGSISMFSCSQCEESFTTADYLAAHQKKKHESKKHPCHLCEYSTDKKSDLELHKKAVHEKSVEKKHKCYLCPYSTHKNKDLVDHMRTHSGERPFQCFYCEQRFTQRGNLNTHEQTVHQKQQPYVCITCRKAFGQKSSLVLHNRTVHEGLKRHKCFICNKRFGQNGSLINHMRIHTGEKPYQCTVCQKRFSQKGQCREHERKVHTKENLV